MSFTNNAINTPDLKAPGNLLIGTGTIPIVGPLLGFGNITVTPVGTAISISGGGTSTFASFAQTFVWGTEFQDQIPCASRTFFSSFISPVEGALRRVSMYWVAATPGKLFSVSIWDDAGNPLTTTNLFDPNTSGTLPFYITRSFQAGPLNAQMGKLYWIELRPQDNLNDAQVYGQQTVATNGAAFNRFEDSWGSTGISPVGKAASNQRIWYYLQG